MGCGFSFPMSFAPHDPFFEAKVEVVRTPPASFAAHAMAVNLTLDHSILDC